MKNTYDFKAKSARHKYQGIRHHAHRVAKLNKMIKKCLICGYETHVDLCHKKLIASFSKNSKISVVNSKENLIYLCKNHHWELDNKIITIP